MIDGKDIAILAVVAIAALVYSHEKVIKLAQEQIDDLGAKVEKQEAYIQGVEKGANLVK